MPKCQSNLCLWYPDAELCPWCYTVARSAPVCRQAPVSPPQGISPRQALLARGPRVSFQKRTSIMSSWFPVFILVSAILGSALGTLIMYLAQHTG